MRVGIVSYDFYPSIGGQGVYVYEVYQRLAEEGVTPFVFSSRESGFENTYCFQSKNNIIFSLASNLWVNKWVDQHHLDLVHFQGGPGGVFLLRKPKVPLIYTAHHVYSQQYQFLKRPVYKLLMRIERRGYLLSDTLISVSTTTKTALNNNYGISPEKVEVIPNGVDSKIFHSLDLPRIPDSLLYVGRLHERKGLVYLIEAVRLLREEKPAIKLFLIGSGKLQGELQKKVSQESLDDNVVFLGNVSQEDLVQWYNRVQLFVLPSLFEGFGIVCIEAMACGAVVVGTKVPGIIDIVRHGENGMLVPSQNGRKLADVISQLLSNTELRQKMSKIGREETLRKFNWESITSRIIKLYERVLANGNS